MRRLALILAFLAACSPRGEIVLDPDAGQVGTTEVIFVGTTRMVDPETGDFGGDRLRDSVSYGRYTVSVPPDRAVGDITYPTGRTADPRTDFLTTEALAYEGAAAFRADLSRALATLPKGQREVTVFTHGFNNTFAEGLYRIAQMTHDLENPGVQVHYSWPSRGKPLAYVHDRDSALFARDGLETLLQDVAAAGAERIVIVGHSMGAALAMETLRQIAIRGNAALMARIGGVVLLSPDIDIDVFHAQASMIGRLPQPFFIFTSRRDKALALSARLTGTRQERLGNIKDLDQIADLEVTVVDVAAFSVGDGHFNVSKSPALIGLLGQIGDVAAAYGRDRTGRPGLLPGVVLTVQNVTQVVLRPVAVIGGGTGGAGR